MKRGSFTISVPLLWMIGALALIAMTALGNVAVSTFMPDRALHDTYYVVMHWRGIIVTAVVFCFFAGWYYLFPKVTGFSYSAPLGKTHFWLTFIGVCAMNAPAVLAPLYVRRIVDDPSIYGYVVLPTSIGAWLAARRGHGAVLRRHGARRPAPPPCALRIFFRSPD
jgi:cytochrome c oxidase subunit 1